MERDLAQRTICFTTAIVSGGSWIGAAIRRYECCFSTSDTRVNMRLRNKALDRAREQAQQRQCETRPAFELERVQRHIFQRSDDKGRTGVVQ